MRPTIIILLFSTILLSCSSNDSSIIEDINSAIYFPPISGNEWETVTPSSLNWNDTEEQELYEYLEQKGTKGFIILKDGKIAIEKYFNGHNRNANWIWFSAAKSLTAATIGIAQDEGIIDINAKTSDYLGANWSTLSDDKQNLITVKHHLTMTTGLKDNLGDNLAWICTWPICLTYKTDAGSRWSYHQGAFTLLQEMITQNSGMNFNAYYAQKLKSRIGMNGVWNNVSFLNLYSSTSRSMARFGLLMLNKGKWDKEEILSEDYYIEMTNTSQNLNKSYGYLWWLNGKESYKTTQSEQSFSGKLIPNAPDDLVAALGANDQKIYVIPSKNMVIIRCGESAGNAQLAHSSFDNELWEKINLMMN